MQSKIPAIAAVIVVIVVIITAGTYVSTKSDTQNDERFGIVGAMEEEVKIFLEEIDETDYRKIGDIEFHIGTLGGKNVVVAECGYGKVNAGICVQLMITEFNVTSVINSGVAGTLDPRVGIGNIVVSTDTVQHDYDMHEIGFEHGLIPNVNKISIKADDKLREVAVEAISKVSSETEVFEGRICTGDQFISGIDEMMPIVEAFGGLCCEMEGGAVAQVCYLNNVPFVIIRAISDNINGEGPEDYSKFEKEMADKCAKMTIEMLKAI